MARKTIFPAQPGYFVLFEGHSFLQVNSAPVLAWLISDDASEPAIAVTIDGQYDFSVRNERDDFALLHPDGRVEWYNHGPYYDLGSFVQWYRKHVKAKAAKAA